MKKKISKSISIIVMSLALLLTSCQSEQSNSIAEITDINTDNSDDVKQILKQDFENYQIDENFNDTLLSISNRENSSQSLMYERIGTGDPSKSNGSIIVNFDKVVDITNSNFLSMQIKDTQGNNTVKMSLIDINGDESNFSWVDLSKTKKNTWVELVAPLSQFNNVDTKNIIGVRIGQWNKGVYYLDDIQFIKESKTVSNKITIVPPMIQILFFLKFNTVI